MSVFAVLGLQFVLTFIKRLLDYKAQEEYYSRIVERYMRFCAQHAKDLDAAFSSLLTSPTSDAASKNAPASSRSRCKLKREKEQIPRPADELSTIILSLRKLREGIKATTSTTPIQFSQRVYMFSIRLCIRAQHDPSYFPSLCRLLEELHSPSHPLQEFDLQEFTSYLILDYACRQKCMVTAYEVRARARKEYNFKSRTVDRVLTALMHDNWVVFWNIRKSVDSYVRAIMNHAVGGLRRHALKAVGSAYINVDLTWIMENCTGDKDSWTWEKLAEAERIGWQKEGDRIIIRRTRQRPEKKLSPIKEAT